MKKMSFKCIFNRLCAKTLNRAMSDRQPREDRETISPVYRPVCVSYVSRVSLVALLLLLLGGWNSVVWGADCNYTTINNFVSSKNTQANGDQYRIWVIYKFNYYDYYDVPTFEFGNVTNNYGISHVKLSLQFSGLHAITEQFQLQYKVGNGSWTNIGNKVTASVVKTDIDQDVSIAGASGQKVYFRLERVEKAKFTDTQTLTLSGFEVRMKSTISANVSSINFGNVTYGNSKSEDVTAYYTLNYSGDMTATCTGDFSATLGASCGCSTAQQTKTVTVKFTPTQAGTRTGTLTIKNPDGTQTTVSLTGTGVRANPTLKMNNSSVNVTTDQANPVTLNLANLKASGTTSGIGDFDHFEVRSADAGTGAKIEGVTINGNNFSSIVGGTYTIRAITKQNNQYNSTYKDFTVTVNRRTQTINWNTTETVFVEEDVISATSIGDVTLEKNGTGAEYVTIDGNTATVGEVETNSSVTLTATAAQTDVYAQATDSKTITLTSLQKQHITFEQNLTKLKTTDGTKKVELIATSDSGRDSYITFAVDANTAGVTVTKEDGKWYLNYSGTAVKGIAVTASLAGVDGVSVAASDVSQMVKVTDPTAKCDINEGLATASGLANTTKTYDLTIPKQVVLKVRSSKSKIYTNTYEVKFYDKNNKEISTGSTQSWTGRTWDQTIDTRTFSNLNKDIVKMVFKSNASNGFDITDASYTRWSYANPSVTELNFEALALSTVADKTFTLDYANYQVELSIEGSSNFVLKSDDSFGDCETYGTQTIKVGYNVPAEATVEKAFLYIKDNTGTELAKITLNATVQGGLTQNITSHNIGTAYKTTDLVNLTATTDRGLTNFSYSATPEGVANFDGAQMTFSKSGTIAITVTEAGNGAYAEASATVNNVVVSKVKPDIATNPSGTAVTYLQNLSASTLSGGLADVTLRGVANSKVDGSFAWTNPNARVEEAAGNRSYEVTFKPDDAGMYNNQTCQVAIQVNKADQTLAMNDGSVKVAVEGLDANAADSKLDLSTLIASQTTDPVNNNRVGAVTYKVISANASNATINGNIFSATAIGDYTIRATKAQTDYYNATTADFTVTVGKRGNTITTAGPYTKYVDEEVAEAATVVNSDGEIHTSSSDATIAYYDITNNKIVIPNSEAKSFDTKEVTIKIWQDETERFEGIAEADAKTITLTVKKYDNAILVKGVANYVNTITTDSYDNGFVFTANNTDYENSPIIVTQTEGNEIATYYDTAENPKVVYSNSKLGTATWSVTQAESYKYKAAVNTFTVKVENAAMGQCFMYNDQNEYEVSTHITSFQGEETDKWYIPDAQNAQELYYEAKKSLLASEQFFIQYSKNGTDWTDLDQPDLSNWGSYQTYGPIDVSNIDFVYLRATAKTWATGTKNIKNIRLTRKPNLSAEGISITKTADNQTLYFGNVGAGKVNVNWSVVDGGDIHIVSNNDKFTIPQDVIPNTECNSGATPVTILYHPTSTKEESATITIYNTNQRVEVTVTGKAGKAPQTIVWYINGEAVDTRTNPKPAVRTTDIITARTNRNHEVTFTSVSNAELMEITANGTLIPLQEGEVTVYAHGAVDEEDRANYAEVNDQLTFVVTEAAIQTIVWDQTFLGLDQNIEDIPLTAYAKWTDENGNEQRREVTYTVADESVAQVVDGKLNILTPGTTIITATAPGGEENGITFLEAIATKKIVVRDPNADCDRLIYTQSEEKAADCGWNLTHKVDRSIIFDLSEYGEPRTCNFDYTGASHKDLVGVYYFYAGTVKVEQYLSTTNQWVEVETSLSSYSKGSKDGAKGTYVNSGDIQLDAHATKVQVSVYGAVGYFYVNNMQITLARYIEPDQETMELGEHSVGEVFKNEVPLEISYSNVAGPITITSSKPDLFYVAEENRMLDVECGAEGMKAVNVYYHPVSDSESDEAVLTISDGKMTKEVTLHASTVDLRYIFNSENTTWEQNNNWVGKDAPTSGDYVVEIQTDVVLTSNVSVYSLTIDEGATLTIGNGGTLTIGEGNSIQKETYGNLHVAKGGKVRLTTGELIVNDFVLDAELADQEHSGRSGQVHNTNQLVVNGDAYFDLALDPSGECSPGWYDFTVPFPVNAVNGVTRFDNSTHLEKTIKCETNYAIMDFSENRRVETGYGWKKYHSVMQPGQCYTITIDDVDNVYRFKKTATGSLNLSSTTLMAYSDVENENKGWNCLGNGTLEYANLSAEGIEKVHIYSHATNSYTAVPLNEYTYVVGSAYMIQTPSAGKEITYTHEGGTRTLRAPRRSSSETEFMLSLSQEGANYSDDRLYVSADEEATYYYEAGRELTKFAAPTDSKVAQVWANAYGMKLCDVEAPLVDDEAVVVLSFYAPKAGSYTFAIDRMPEDEADLYLTYNGSDIWNLTESPYTLDLAKGTTEGYGLRIQSRNAPQITTGVDEINGEKEGNRKVLIGNDIYIITKEGAIFNATGKKVK